MARVDIPEPVLGWNPVPGDPDSLVWWDGTGFTGEAIRVGDGWEVVGVRGEPAPTGAARPPVRHPRRPAPRRPEAPRRARTEPLVWAGRLAAALTALGMTVVPLLLALSVGSGFQCGDAGTSCDESVGWGSTGIVVGVVVVVGALTCAVLAVVAAGRARRAPDGRVERAYRTTAVIDAIVAALGLLLPVLGLGLYLFEVITR